MQIWIWIWWRCGLFPHLPQAVREDTSVGAERIPVYE